uniref:ORF64 n=1 Tax=Malaco herpesvirus 1 TaxID=3031797 RepID=A0AA48SF10_9VIRU|nr:TPA_asm: ORF64 [Malaco herpesvirus 1]
MFHKRNYLYGEEKRMAVDEYDIFFRRRLNTEDNFSTLVEKFTNCIKNADHAGYTTGKTAEHAWTSVNQNLPDMMTKSDYVERRTAHGAAMGKVFYNTDVDMATEAMVAAQREDWKKEEVKCFPEMKLDDETIAKIDELSSDEKKWLKTLILERARTLIATGCGGVYRYYYRIDGFLDKLSDLDKFIFAAKVAILPRLDKVIRYNLNYWKMISEDLLYPKAPWEFIDDIELISNMTGKPLVWIKKMGGFTSKNTELINRLINMEAVINNMNMAYRDLVDNLLEDIEPRMLGMFLEDDPDLQELRDRCSEYRSAKAEFNWMSQQR